MVWRWLGICVGVCAAIPLGGVALAQPVVPGLPVAAQPEPGRGYPLPTDGLMAPAPLVPPRSSYQRPPPVEPRPNSGLPGPLDFTLPNGADIPVPSGGGAKQFRFIPRYGRPYNLSTNLLEDGTTRRFIVTGGLIVNVNTGPGGQEIEFATDDAVVWVRGKEVNNLPGGFDTGGEDQKTEVELYMTGNVVIRTMTPGQGATPPVIQTLRAAEVYYDVSRSKAIALNADLELASPKVPDGAHLRGREIRRLDVENWEILGGSVFSSKLPSDPGLKFDSSRMTMRERKIARRNVFGIPFRDLQTGEPVMWNERQLTLHNAVTRLNEVPIFYSPRLRTDASDPLGPLLGLNFGQDRIFGSAFYTTWDMYELIALRPPPGHQWRLNLDYLSARGPAIGSDYRYTLPPPTDGLLPRGRGFARGYFIQDNGTDILGGDRGPQPQQPVNRGRAMWRHQQDFDDVLDGLYFQGQLAYVSDKNFLEQYYNNEWNLGPNQETFAYLTWQRQNVWASGLVMPRLARPWMGQTEWWPRLDGAVIGQSFWDTLVYSARANAAYAQGRSSEDYPTVVQPTDRNVNIGRFDLQQELSLPFDLGPLKLAPYGTLDLADYTQDLTGSNRGRVIGGGGVRGSVPLSRLYEEASSELFNVRGLYHKVVLGANYYYAQSNTPYSQLPMLDRLNDDAVDQAYRTIRPYEPSYVPGPAGLALATSPIFDPQRYAIRRLVDNRVDTLDSINVLQGDIRQRFQTKRGYPGLEHTVDVFTLDLSASYFPQANRDNFGKPFGFLEYGALWNIGDRVAVLSSGWFDPFDYGAKYYNVGVSFDRPDRTNFYLGYRQTDPLNSKAVTASVGYQMSRRYYVNLGVSYDFGIQQALSNTFSLTRTGSDLTFTVGFTYNALVNNFGFQFLVIPNVVAAATGGRFNSTQLLNR